MPAVLIATRNQHKIQEIRSILGDRFEYLSSADFPQAPDPVENASTFEGNATIKAVTLANWLATRGQAKIEYVLADDSGLEVDALNGAPGVHSARFASDGHLAGNTPDTANNQKLLELLENVPPVARSARFRCVIAWTPVPQFHSPSASPVCDASEAELSTTLFSGSCEGHILPAPQGSGGFGYDPLFVPQGCEKSFADLGEKTKNELSHRAKALEKLRLHLANVR